MDILDLLLQRAVFFIPILLSLTVHEWAHAWTALKLGDDTAKMLGRVSLNPIDHIDPVGTLLLPLLGVPFGWAKPVPINPVRFHKQYSMPFGVMLTAAAGPISNLLLAAIGCGIIFVMTHYIGNGLRPETYDALMQIVTVFVLINILLACFNLLPIPPLDGSRIADALMPNALRPAWSQFSSLGPVLLIAVIGLPFLTGFSLLSYPIQWTQQFLLWISTV